MPIALDDGKQKSFFPIGLRSKYDEKIHQSAASAALQTSVGKHNTSRPLKKIGG
jgi:hypothetical protein